jgi:HlyD family secretion protein
MAKKKRGWIKWAVIAILIVGGIADIFIFFGDDIFKAPQPEGFVSASGRIEGRLTDVSSKVPGRIVEINFEEGDEVKAGQVLARISDDELQAKLRADEANLRLLQSQMVQAEIDVRLTTRQVESTKKQAEAQLGVAKAQLARADSAAEQAASDYERSKDLFDQGTVSRTQFEHDRLAHTLAVKEVEVTRKTLEEARANLDLAREMELSIDLKKARLKELEEGIASATAERDLIAVLLDECTVVAPIDGIVLDRIVDRGEVVNTGSAIASVVNPDDLYLKIFVPTAAMSKVKIGNEARIFPDGLEDIHFDAQVVKIAQRAEFTPKNVETRQQRTNLVFEIRLGSIDNTERMLKPGMSAEATVRLDESLDWARR